MTQGHPGAPGSLGWPAPFRSTSNPVGGCAALVFLIACSHNCCAGGHWACCGRGLLLAWGQGAASGGRLVPGAKRSRRFDAGMNREQGMLFCFRSAAADAGVSSRREQLAFLHLPLVPVVLKLQLPCPHLPPATGCRLEHGPVVGAESWSGRRRPLLRKASTACVIALPCLGPRHRASPGARTRCWRRRWSGQRRPA